MPSHISPLDGNYISLRRAALLIAREQSDIAPDDIMDTFKHALFAREFEDHEIAVEGMASAEHWNLPLLRIEAPPGPVGGSASPSNQPGPAGIYRGQRSDHR
jgi:hypothetical protein